MNFFILSDKGLGLSPPEPPPEKVPPTREGAGVRLPVQGPEEPASERGFSSQIGSVEPGEGEN